MGTCWLSCRQQASACSWSCCGAAAAVLAVTLPLSVDSAKAARRPDALGPMQVSFNKPAFQPEGLHHVSQSTQLPKPSGGCVFAVQQRCNLHFALAFEDLMSPITGGQ